MSDNFRNENKHSRSTDYLGMIYNDPELFKLTFERLVKCVRKNVISPEKTAIAFRGMSGAAVAFGLSMRLNMPLVGVRKPGDGSHFTASLSSVALGEFGHAIDECTHYIIVDDMIDTGGTIHEIVETVGDMLQLESIFLYQDTYGCQIFPSENANETSTTGTGRYLAAYPERYFPIYRSGLKRT